MKVKVLLTIAGIASGLAHGSVAHGQGNMLLMPSTREAGPVVAPGDATTVVDEGEIRRRMSRAERAYESGAHATARRIYESVVVDLTAANQLPTEAMWRLATVKYESGARIEAAATLDALAAAAASFGAMDVQVLSLLEAARIYQMEGAIVESVDRLSRGVSLISSPAMSSEMQISLLRKVRG